MARGNSSDGNATLERPDVGDASHSQAKSDPSASATDLVGRTLAHFRVVERLGAGGMGVVYKAIDQKLRRPVALKVLSAAYLIDDRNREILVREARSAAALTHPNIAAIHEVHDGPDGAFFVMELVLGETLRERIERAGAMKVDEALRWASAIARALACAHAAGVVHRDLKADNVMLTTVGDLKLLDFGLAKVVDDPEHVVMHPDSSAPAAHALAPTIPATARVTAHGSVMGTPAYMAPEQARGEAVDARADVFAFGVVLYEMLTTRLPFAHRTGAPWTWGDAKSGNWTPSERVRAATSGVPREVEQLVNKCLAFDASARFADGAELVKGVDECAERTSRAGRSRLAMIAVGATVIVAVGAIEWRANRAREAERAASAAASVTAEIAPDAPLPFAKIPPSRTSDPAVRESYRLGLQAMAQGLLPEARRKLSEALARDTSFSSAYLQLAYLDYVRAVPALESMRHNFAQATSRRLELSRRDGELLDALSPAIIDPQDLSEAARRLEQMVRRRPGDAEAWNALGIALTKTGRSAEAIRAFTRESIVDESSALGLGVRALLETAEDDLEAAQRTYADCARRSPTAIGCREGKARLLGVGGDCAAMDQEGREIIVLSPEGPTGYRLRFDAQAGLGAPEETLQELLTQTAAHSTTATPTWTRIESMRIASWFGDFNRALELEAEVERTGDADARGDARPWRVELLQETGHGIEAGRAAADLLHRSNVLPAMESLRSDRSMIMLAAALHGGALSQTEFRRRRDAWLERWHTQLGEEGWSSEAPYAWALAFAATASTDSEAREALARLAAFGPIPSPGNTSFVDFDDVTGEVFRLAGKLDEAMPRLRAASRRCALDLSIPRSELRLGLLLESQRDTTSACASYARVMARWGAATPLSTTADDARRHSRSLGCAPPQ